MQAAFASSQFDISVMGPEEFPCHCWHLRDDGAARPLLLLLALGKAQTLLTKYNPPRSRHSDDDSVISSCTKLHEYWNLNLTLQLEINMHSIRMTLFPVQVKKRSRAFHWLGAIQP